MYPSAITKEPAAVEQEVQRAFLRMFPDSDVLFVPRAFEWFLECFSGHYQDYQAVDTRYHDLEHTLQGTLCMAWLLLGRHQARALPVLPPKAFELGILAILLHDTGYLKHRDDQEGTGAKYTLVHVARSAEFAAELMLEKGFSPSDINAVGNMIACTGVNVDLRSIPFQSEWERICGSALATADLLGQMAAEDYVEKLPVLYEEFAEAGSYSKDGVRFAAAFASAAELLAKTPQFWERHVLARLDSEFGGLYKFLNNPYPSGPNVYLKCVEANIERIKRGLASAPVVA